MRCPVPRRWVISGLCLAFARDAAPAAHPTEYAWQTLAKVGAAKTAGEPAQWESWPAKSDLFEGSMPDCQKENTGKHLTSSSEFAAFRLLSSSLVRLQSRAQLYRLIPGPPPASNFEIRFNRTVCDTVLARELWHQPGVGALVGQTDLIFDDDSVAVKAFWERGSSQDKCDDPRFHCFQEPGKERLRVTALHLAVVNPETHKWFWATWEQEDQGKQDCPTRYDYSFGFDTKREPTQELKNLFPDGSEWLHYRLVGTQSEYMGPDNKPTVLGNKVIEKDFAGSSSCISCHARATTNSSGYPTSLWGCPGNDPLHLYLEPDCHFCPVNPIGTPEPRWYQSDAKTRSYVQTGFLWSVAGLNPPQLPSLKEECARRLNSYILNSYSDKRAPVKNLYELFTEPHWLKRREKTR